MMWIADNMRSPPQILATAPLVDIPAKLMTR
jgi:hypothetical protein